MDLLVLFGILVIGLLGFFSLLPSHSQLDQGQIFTVVGRLILSNENSSGTRTFRFFNHLQGKARTAALGQQTGASGVVRVELPDHFVQQEKILGDARRQEPLIELVIEHLTGIENCKEGIYFSQEEQKGELIGQLKFMGLAQDMNIPVHIHRLDEKTVVVEPIGGISYSIEGLGLGLEVSELLEVDQNFMDDGLTIHFKLVMQSY